LSRLAAGIVAAALAAAGLFGARLQLLQLVAVVAALVMVERHRREGRGVFLLLQAASRMQK
jgi:hypothetical protein